MMLPTFAQAPVRLTDELLQRLARPYLDDLHTEIELYFAEIGRGQPLAQLHLGGGSPTFLSDGERALLMGWLREAFRFAPGERAHLVRMREAFAPEYERLVPLQEMGLVEVSEQAIQVTPLGWFFVRGVAMVFDRQLQADPMRERFSRII